MKDYGDCVFIIFNNDALQIKFEFVQAQFKINQKGDRVIHGKDNIQMKLTLGMEILEIFSAKNA